MSHPHPYSARSRSAARPEVIDRAVHGTIVMTSVLVVYDGWSRLQIGAAILVILGSVVAMVIGHVFAASAAAVAELRRRPWSGELSHIVRHESWFVLVCVPQIVLLLVLTLAGLGLHDTVRALIWAGPALLGCWGGVAAWRSGARRQLVAVAMITGIAVGGVVLALRIFLQPGEARSNGV